MGVVFLRPYIGILLNYLLNKGFKISIFTAGSRDYAKGIVNIICDAIWNGENHFTDTLNVQHMTINMATDSKIKDFKPYGYSESNTLLVDNLPRNAASQPYNIIPVAPFEQA